MKIVINDLFDYENRKIYQYDEAFKFSLDSILLAEYVDIKNTKQKIVDFCTGNAAIPLVLSTKYSNNIIGIEIQKEIFELAKKSVEINNLQEQIKMINDNVLNITNHLNSESIDIITCNPPYFKLNNESLINENKMKAIARHEIELTLDSLIKSANYILKNKGYFYMIHRTDRLEEIIMLLNKYNFSIKELQFIYTKENFPAELCIIKALKNGKYGLTVKKPVITSNLKSYKNIFRK